MKTTLVFSCLSIILCASCKNNTRQESKPASQESRPMAGWTDCYLYTSGKDTVALQLHRDADSASGRLIYNFYEKDRNTGTISGTIHGDTLIAVYTFMSEGIQSTRQIAFLKNNHNQLTEGAGMSGQSGVLDRTYDFSSGIVLQPSADCSVFFPGK
jgi:hypothetical protein